VSWFLAFAGFAVLIILHELGHFLAAKAVGMRVERFSLFFPPFLARKKLGDTEYAVGALPLGGYVKITGMNPDEELSDEERTRAYSSQPVWKRVVVIAAGPCMNLILAFILLLVFFWQIGPQDVSQRVGDIQPGYPAQGQLQPGDRLISVDGKGGSPAALSDAIAAHACPGTPTPGCKAQTPATVVVQRGDRQLTYQLTPVYDTGTSPPKPRLGFSYASGGPHRPLPFGQALGVSAQRYGFISKETVTLPARLFDSQTRKQISGVVGSYEVTRETIVQDAGRVVGILAIISLSLAIVNLFPFLPLDGGHIFWAIVEKIRGKPVSYSVMERAGIVGFMLVLGVFLIGLTNDIDRLTGQGFGVR
jgi:regulator of sigma E protease